MGKPPVSGEPERREFAKFLIGFSYAFQGLWYTLRTQRNAHFHLGAAILVTIAGLLLHVSALEFAILYLAISSVFVAEMFNTVCEICVDIAQPEYHPLAKIAKDVAAGAVLMSAILAAIVGLFVLGPHLWALFLVKR